MFIQTETSPDGLTMRFLPGRAVHESGVADFADAGAAAGSSLARSLFSVDGVSRVSLGSDYVAVRRTESADWQIMKPHLLGIIMDALMSGGPIPSAPPEGPQPGPADGAAVAAIRELLEHRIGPGLAAEGCEVSLQGYENGVVRLGLRATDPGAPLFALEVKIENTLRHQVPEISRVEFVREPAPTTADDAAAPADRPGLSSEAGLAIQQLLEERINPAVAAHGGHISLVDVQEDRAYIRLEGGCQGCGMATATLRQGVEMEILREVPSISAVLDVTDHESGANPYY